DHPDCDVRIIRPSFVGVSAARNAGIAAATHDVIVLADDDILAEQDWLSVLLTGLVREGDRAVVCGKVVAGAPEVPGAVAPSTTADLGHATFAGRVNRDPLCSHNCVLHKTVFASVGGFDERLGPGTPFRAAEDNDLGFRLLEAGYRIVIVPE